MTKCYLIKSVHTLILGWEREREKEGEREGERDRERERKGGRERGERDNDRGFEIEGGAL